MSKNQVKNLTYVLWFIALVFLVGILIKAKPIISPRQVGADAPDISGTAGGVEKCTKEQIDSVLKTLADRNDTNTPLDRYLRAEDVPYKEFVTSIHNNIIFHAALNEKDNERLLAIYQSLRGLINTPAIWRHFRRESKNMILQATNFLGNCLSQEQLLPPKQEFSSSMVKISNGYGQVVGVGKGKDSIFNDDFYWIYIVVPTKLLPEPGWKPWLFDVSSYIGNKFSQFTGQVIYAFQRGGIDPPSDPAPPQQHGGGGIGFSGGIGLQYGTPPTIVHPFIQVLGEIWDQTSKKWVGGMEFVKGPKGWQTTLRDGTDTGRDMVYAVKVDGMKDVGLTMLLVRTGKYSPVYLGTDITGKTKIVPSSALNFADPKAGPADILLSTNDKKFRITSSSLFDIVFNVPFYPEYIKSVVTCALIEVENEDGAKSWKIDTKGLKVSIPIGSKIIQNGMEVGIHIGDNEVLPSSNITELQDSILNSMFGKEGGE